ncbi:MAG TPA: HAD-IIIC family phosphatase [Bryobacteraceae bacterium]|nr:HAD-IIIC family phosphatase [Bryobacteraceae bacterium]
MQAEKLRREIDQHLEGGAWARALAGLKLLWAEQPVSTTASFVSSRFDHLRAHIALTHCRVAILRSFTVEPCVPLLKAAGLAHGLDLTVHVGEFNSYAQELLHSQSPLYEFSPDVIFLAVQLRDIAPELYSGYADLDCAATCAIVERVIASIESWTRAARLRSKASFVLHNFEQPVAPNQGLLDAQGESTQQLAVQELNRALRRIAASQAGVYVLDYDALVARTGRSRWYDERKWLMARLPVAAPNLIHLVNEWLRFLHPLCGKVCKVVVTDLDNTLWGGVLGEDGVEGIQAGQEYPGGAYWSVQRALLDFYQRGILLAISSKNDHADALRAIDSHRGMLLRPHHFASTRINWNDKCQSLREIAEELNVGLDSLAFLDDNPAERERIRMELPEVHVIELPREPFDYADALRNAPVFERLKLSQEDRERNNYYAGQRQRTELAGEAESIEDFYRSLDQEVEIAPADSSTFGRVAQLTQKTNQFNLTTRRYSQQQIEALSADPDYCVHTVRVKDRFGDNGLVGVAIVRRSGRTSEIDTLLLSCRVIGRTVEKAVLSHLAAAAREEGSDRLSGWFLPTKKNAPAREFYSENNFELVRTEDGKTQWSLDLKQAQVRCPDWIRLITPKEYLKRVHTCS